MSGSRSVMRSRVGDQRAGSRAAARADRNAVVARPLDEVPDDQEVAAVAHAVDHAELVLGALERRRRDRVAEAPGEPLHHQLAQVLGLDHPAGAVEARDQLLAELDLDIATLGDLERRGRSPPATRRTSPPSRRSSAGRTRWCRRSSSAPPASTWSARTAAPCGCRSPRGAGSARHRCRPAGDRPRARSSRSRRWPSPGRRCRSSEPRSRRCRGRRSAAAHRPPRAPRPHGRRPATGRSAMPGSRSTRSRPPQYRDINPASTVGLPRCSPSRKPEEQSLTRLR